MTPDPNSRPSPEKLEQLVHRALRDLPARRAPRALEQRVLAELARRAALPWWHKSFAHWPLPARLAFVVVSAVVIKLMLMATFWAMSGFDTTQVQQVLVQPIAWWEGCRVVVNAVTGFCEVLLRSIPALWLYGGLAFIATMYAALFGLGAAAYKMLRAPHQSSFSH